jgi:hypothetical protein
MALETKDGTRMGFDTGHTFPFVAIVVPAFANHQSLLQFLLVERFLNPRFANSHAFELLGHKVEFFDDVVVSARFGREGTAARVVGVVDVVLVFASGTANELVLVEESLHALVLFLDHDAFASPGFDVQVESRDVFGEL